MSERRAKPEATYVGRPLRWRLVRLGLIIAATGVAASAAVVVAAERSAQEAPVEAELKGGSVAPKRAFFDSVKGVRIAFSLRADEPVKATVRIRRRGRLIRSFVIKQAEPGIRQEVVWDGITGGGKAAPDGRYRAFVTPKDNPSFPLGRFTLRGHFFPVRGPHWTRGAIGEFSADRSGGREHEGFDVVADCGTPLAAVRAGRVTHRGYDADLYGNFIEIKGRKERRSYFYSHLPKPALPKRDELVKTAERIGRVGRTGNARDVPGCHLHFEIHRRGGPIDPEADLREWDRYS